MMFFALMLLAGMIGVASLTAICAVRLAAQISATEPADEDPSDEFHRSIQDWGRKLEARE